MSDTELQKWMFQATFKARRELAVKVKEQADKLAGAIRDAAPVKTGALRDSVKVRRTRNQLKFYVTVGGDETNVSVRDGTSVAFDYSRAVEYGTKNRPAHAFIYPTARAMEDEINEALQEAVADALGL